MSANRLFLVCSKHPHTMDAIELADRSDGQSHYACTNLVTRGLQKWLAIHRDCGVDQFTVAYEKPKGWDVSPPAPAVASAVRVALATDQLNGEIHGPAGADWREH